MPKSVYSFTCIHVFYLSNTRTVPGRCQCLCCHWLHHRWRIRSFDTRNPCFFDRARWASNVRQKKNLLLIQPFHLLHEVFQRGLHTLEVFGCWLTVMQLYQASYFFLLCFNPLSQQKLQTSVHFFIKKILVAASLHRIQYLSPHLFALPCRIPSTLKLLSLLFCFDRHEISAWGLKQ